MKILCLADKESEYLWDYYQPGRLKGVDLILSCGDLSSKYLSFLVTMSNAPLFYVRGNHDNTYGTNPPEGCECIEDKLITVNGVRILGLGGSFLYSGGPNQYSEKQMEKRIKKLSLKLWSGGGVDIVVAHSPVKDYGDGQDYAHQGFECFKSLIDKYSPKYFVHGHVHSNYVPNMERINHRGETTIINVYERYIVDI